MDKTIKNINLLNYEEGPTALELNGNEITTNLGIIYRDPDILIRPNYVYMDTNNVPEGPEMLEAAGYGKPLQVWGQPYVVSSGFCDYPVYEIDIKKMLADHPEAKNDYVESMSSYIESFTVARANMYLNDPFMDFSEGVSARECGAPALGYLNALDAFSEEDMKKFENVLDNFCAEAQPKIDAILKEMQKNVIPEPVADDSGEDFGDEDEPTYNG